MKFLIVDKEPPNDYGRIGLRCKSALQQLGHETQNFCYRKFYFHKFNITRRIIDYWLLNEVKRTKPEVLLVLKGESLLQGTIKKISNLGIKTVNWCNDEPFGQIMKSNKIFNISEYDYFFLYDKLYVKKISKINKNTYQLPPGADPFEIYKEEIPLEKRQYKYDVSVLGSRYESRERILPQITNFNLAIAGPSWKKTIPKLRPFVVNSTWFSIRDLVRFFNESKINLNIYYYHYKNPDILEPRNSIPQHRTFEIPASNSFQICEKLRDIDDYFEPDKEIVFYKNVKDLRDKISYYLENEKERLKITKTGHKRVKKEHTYVHRMHTLINTIDD